jgi:hypothetical protein
MKLFEKKEENFTKLTREPRHFFCMALHKFHHLKKSSNQYKMFIKDYFHGYKCMKG